MEKILVLGGSSNMGLATTQLAVDKGYEVVIAGRTLEKLQAAQSSVRGKAEIYQVDLMHDQQLEKLFSEVASIKHIVITVSAPASASSLVATDVEAAKNVFERFWMNYRVLYYAKQHLLPKGSITLISGSSSKTPVKGYGVWGTLHGSIEALTKHAAIELAPIRINVISPGGIGLSPNHQLLEHYGQPADVAKMILAIIENPAVTNTKIDVDSGERQGEWSAE